MKKKVLLIAVILVFALLAASLSSCGKQAAESIDETPAAQITEMPAPAEAAETEEPVVTEEPRDWEPVETKFGDLRYPDQWFDSLETEQTETDDSVTVAFRAKVNEQSFDLFDVCIGQNAVEGEAVGVLTGPDGVQREAFLRFHELGEITGLNEGETNRVYAMQEALNFVIDNLK